MSGPDERIVILGDGQMGLVMADALATHDDLDVRLWGPFPEPLAALDETRAAPSRLPEFLLPPSVHVVADDAAALAGVTLVVNAIPTQHVRAVWRRLAPHVPPGAAVVCVSKGFEIESLLTPTEVIRELLAEEGAAVPPVCAMSGPTIAQELARRLPATMVAASTDETLAQRTQQLFSVRWLRVYRLDDVVGVEVAGAAKNVIALAAGMIDGLEAGANAKSALLARGLAEIARLGVAMGARLDTFFGVAGVGDLATTCFSPFGRNRTCGERLGRGEPLERILETTVSVVEGVPTTRAVRVLSRQHGVAMPICDAVYRILFEGLAPGDAVWSLMEREPKAERIG